MKIVPVLFRSLSNAISHRYQMPRMARTLLTDATRGNGIDDRQSTDSFESHDEFERRIFGGNSQGSSKSDAFFQKLDRLEKARDGFSSKLNGQNRLQMLDDLDESFNSLQDGVDGKLEKAAQYFQFDPEEVTNENYSFRDDINLDSEDLGMTTYEPEHLDLRKPGIQPYVTREQFETTTDEVLRNADFRNVRFLANFITDAGVIIKRSQTGISAKAQRKVAREIKTARAFGLLPFTTMGTKSFVFGKTMEDHDEDFHYQSYNYNYNDN